MLSDKVRAFVAANHDAVLSTFRRSGAVQLSIVTVGPYRDGVAFTTTAGRAKVPNLRRDPRCSLLVSTGDWGPFVVLEGRATVLREGDTDPEELRHALRDVYRSAAGKEHPDWAEYDRRMVEERRAAVIVVPSHVYGSAA